MGVWLAWKPYRVLSTKAGREIEMASGKTHDWVAWASLPSVFLVCRWGMDLTWTVTALVTVGAALGGLLFSPDLDTRSRPFYRWGVFRFIWWPYQWAIRHRSGWSHGVLFAPWLRLLYFSAVLIVLYTGLWLLLGRWGGMPVGLEIPRWQVVGFLHRHLNDILLLGVGIWLGSLMHVVLDAASSRWPFRRPRR